MPTHPLSHLFTLKERGLEIVEIRIPAGSVAVGKALKELNIPPGSFLTLIIRKGENPLIPASSVVLKADDQIVAVTTPDAVKPLREALRGAQ